MNDVMPGEACGVFGAFSTDQRVQEQIPHMALRALGVMQHRGQEAAGIVVSDEVSLNRHVGPGRVAEVFSDPNSLQKLGIGPVAVAHVRYGTISTQDPNEAGGPVLREGFAVAHNGHWQAEVLDELGIPRVGGTDTERATNYIMSLVTPDATMEQTLTRALNDMREGAFSLAVATPNQLFAVRDPYGFRPLTIGKLPGGYAIASESIALDANNIPVLREVSPGEMIVIDDRGLRPTQPFGDTRNLQERLCSFEFGYFAAPASLLREKEVFSYRLGLGAALAEQDKKFIAEAQPDLVIGVPDSGVPAAEGYSRVSGIPYSSGMMKNRYPGRTFIAPESSDRSSTVRTKLFVYREEVAGKSIVVIDDSIVRGTTTRELVNMLFEAGAKEVHLRSTMPMYRYGCHMGMDTSDEDKLIAARYGGNLEAINSEINATTLGFLTISAMRKVLGAHGAGLCTACMDGDYPIRIRSKAAAATPVEIAS